MHVIATNLTIWIGLVIDESAAAIQHSGDPHEESSTSTPLTLPTNDISASIRAAAQGSDHHSGRL